MVLPCGSITWSRFQRHACWHHDASNVDLLHGSPASLPNTGTVHADAVPRPKKYCVPSVVVTFQYSPVSPGSPPSPLAAPVSRSTRVPSSFFSRQALFPADTSGEECPSSDSVAVSHSSRCDPLTLVCQHRSPVRLAGSAMSSKQDW